MQEKQITACYLPLKYNNLTFGMVSHELPGHSVFVLTEAVSVLDG